MVRSSNDHNIDAEEVMQESLVVLYRNARKSSFILNCGLCTYLFAIAKNQWLNELRKRKPIVSIMDVPTIEIDDETLETIEKNERLKLFREKFEELGSNCKKVLRMYLMEIPLPEITRIMGYSSEQVARNQRYKCKKQLVNSIKSTASFKELGYEKV